MRAIQFNASVPRYAFGLAAQKISPAVLWNGLSCTSLREIPEPTLPNDEWVKIKTRYGGICGTDTGTIHLHSSPYYSTLNSFPFTFGHENVGTIMQAGARAGAWKEGDRVVVEPLLWCEPRGFTALCRFCARGEINLCERMTKGTLAPGVMTGFCRDTGGSWSQVFLAHRSQLFRVPDNVSNENAVLVEPFAVGVHAAIQTMPLEQDTVLIVGAGIIGLLTLAALRQLGSNAKIWVLARHGFQADAARTLGATEIISGRGDYFAELEKRTGGEILKPIIGKPVYYGGGADITFEGVGSDASLDDALRLTRHGGRVVLVGVPGIASGVDWTAIFAQELTVQASYIYNHAELYRGEKRPAFSIVLEWMQNGLDLSRLVTHKFKLEQYSDAFALLENKSASKVIKAVFEFE